MSSLSSATQDRKARLAQLKSLKRKQPDTDQEEREEDDSSLPTPTAAASEQVPTPTPTPHLSGRNYDPSSRGPKLGFEAAPSANLDTLEKRASSLAATTAAAAAAEETDDKPLDLFKLQPKKPNWDLKRDLERKMEVLDVRTGNAIARLVREKIEAQRKKLELLQEGQEKGKVIDDGEAVGLEGTTLVEATREREREDEEDARRERELEEAYLDGG